jgi:hypothetical protein
MISINKRLMIIWHEIKLEYYKNAKKKKNKSMKLDLKTKMSKWMKNTSFYGLEFKTIDMMAN